MEGLVKGIINGFLRYSGLGTYIKLLKDDPVWAVVLILALALTLVWLIRLVPKLSAAIGKTIGGLAIGFMILGIGIGIAIGLANMIAHMGAGMIAAAIGSIPLIGPSLAKVANWLISIFVTFVVMIGIGIYFLKNIGSLLEKFMGVITGSAKDWRADGDGGHGGVKWSYVIMGNLVIAGMICHPGLNAKAYYLPAILSGLAGIASILFKTDWGKGQVDHVQAKVVGRPLEDGSWICTFRGPFPLYDKAAWKKGVKRRLKDVNHKQRYQTRRCGFHNPSGNAVCGASDCDAKNPYATWVCPKCAYEGPKGKGIAWDTPKCPKCGKKKPPVPQPKQGHFPWEDTFQSEESPSASPAVQADGSWECAEEVRQKNARGNYRAYKDATTGKVVYITEPCGHVNPIEAQQCQACGIPKQGGQPQPASVGAPVVIDEPVLEVPCHACGEFYDAGLGYTKCPNPACRAPLVSRVDAAPPAPTDPSSVSAPATTPVPKEKKFGLWEFPF